MKNLSDYERFLTFSRTREENISRWIGIKDRLFEFKRKEKARQILNSMKKTTVPTGVSSTEYAFDVMEESAAFGSQLNIKTTAGEFDDIPSFMAGKVLYFVQGSTVEPFAVRFVTPTMNYLRYHCYISVSISSFIIESTLMETPFINLLQEQTMSNFSSISNCFWILSQWQWNYILKKIDKNLNIEWVVHDSDFGIAQIFIGTV